MSVRERRRTTTKARPSSSRRPALRAAARDSVLAETLLLVGLVLASALLLGTYRFLAAPLLDVDEGAPPSAGAAPLPHGLRHAAPQRPAPVRDGDGNDNNSTANDTAPNDEDARRRGSHAPRADEGGYAHFSNLAQDLAALPPADALARLERDDPFGARKFAANLLEHETKRGRVLTMDEIQQLFSCPRREERLTLPDARVEEKARNFREGVTGTFLFFQHLRKAGGTDFCTLAEKNLPRSAYPRYYCMPDMAWSGNRNAGYLHSWSNHEIITRMKSSGYRVAGNEWENFDTSRHFDLPAVFATSFRKPLDRALSQFRFECIEDRGCHYKDVHKWWDHRTDLWNVYTKTFSDRPLGGQLRLHGVPAQERREAMARALDTVSKFHIVLSMEWLVYGAPQVRAVLGFEDVSALTTRVRPHIGNARRDDGQEKNTLGSASIARASWVPKEYLDAAQYKKMSEDLVLDEILTDAARRLFLERLVCEDMGGGVAIQ